MDNDNQEKSLPGSKFSERLKEAIRRKGITQKEFSVRVNVSPVTISRYMGEETRMPGSWDLYRMANSLGVSMEWLLTGDVATEETSWKTRAEEAEKKLASLKTGVATLSKTISGLSKIITE